MTNRFFSLYYFVHLLFVVAYALVRYFKPSASLAAKDDWLGLSRETEIIVTLSLFLFQKYRKRTNFDAFVAQALLYTKTALLVLLYLIDVRFMAWFFISFVIVFVVLPPPKYSGPSSFTIMSGPDFENTVMSENTQSTKVSWMVMFTASWSDSCEHATPLFADLSLGYTTPNFRFAKVDVSRWPEIAEKLKIDVSASSTQLPSFILFEKAEEARRLPPFNSKGEVVRTSFDKEGLIAYFDLDRKIIEGNKKTN